MQQEDLLKRMQLFATMTTVAFVVLIVTLLIQFGFIAFYHTQLTNLERNNIQMQQEIEELRAEIEYEKNPDNQNQ
ncbi:MAG: hypothetical protein IKT33_02340 [Clostridia bacterium]|nr:hypothetical protein [Clostridia bacterium]